MITITKFRITHMGFFLVLLSLIGSIVTADGPSLTPSRGTLTIYATCEGVDFAKLSVKDGITAASRLKTTFNEISSKAGHEVIRKLNYSGPAYTPGSIRTSTKVGVFTGTWYRDGKWVGIIDTLFTPRTPRTLPPREKAWLDALMATWDESFFIELIETGRPVFFKMQRCSLRFEKVEKY
jgi:hypothetical protein